MTKNDEIQIALGNYALANQAAKWAEASGDINAPIFAKEAKKTWAIYLTLAGSPEDSIVLETTPVQEEIASEIKIEEQPKSKKITKKKKIDK